MQSFLSLWLNAGAQITHGGEVQRPRQNDYGVLIIMASPQLIMTFWVKKALGQAHAPFYKKNQIETFVFLKQYASGFANQRRCWHD